MNSDYITASFDTLFSQSKDTAEEYLRKAISSIDERLGDGYAKDHPELIAAFMKTASADFTASSHAKVNGAALQRIAESLDTLARAVEDLRPEE
jgi:hypothetical protein